MPPSHGSGDFGLSYNAQVTDSASGVGKNFTGTQDLSVTPVSTAPIDSSLGGESVGISGSNLNRINLQADFPDNDGSESHFFLVQSALLDTLAGLNTLPAGVTLIAPVDYGNPSELQSGSWYRIDADSNGKASFVLDMTAQTAGTSVSYHAGVYENSLGTGSTAFSDLDADNAITVGIGPFSMPLSVGLSAAFSPDILLPEDGGVNYEMYEGATPVPQQDDLAYFKDVFESLEQSTETPTVQPYYLASFMDEDNGYIMTDATDLSTVETPDLFDLPAGLLADALNTTASQDAVEPQEFYIPETTTGDMIDLSIQNLELAEKIKMDFGG